MRSRRAFTLLEMIMALAACAVILTAVYGVFTRAIQLRNAATERARESRSRAHAAAFIRNDLRNGFVSGGKLAAELTGTHQPFARASSFPGYLGFTTTTARDTSELSLVEALRNDVQKVEYYIVNDPEAEAGQKGGMLVRAIERNLLASPREVAVETPLLHGVEAFEVSFFDGTSWAESWEVREEEKTLPEAVRVTIRSAAKSSGEVAPPIEIVVPWSTQPSIPTT